MNTNDAENRINQMIRLIKQEAEEKAQIIIEEARQKMQKEKNKVYNYQREKLITEYQLKEEQDEITKRLQKSRKINQTRLEIQNHRNNLLENLKLDTEKKLRENIKDKNNYGNLMKNLIVQGMIRLLEKKIVIKCKESDVNLIKGLLVDCEKEYKAFLKKSVNKEPNVVLEVSDKMFLNDKDIGGVVLYCHNYKIVFDNSLRARLDLCFDESKPYIRSNMFVSLD